MRAALLPAVEPLPVARVLAFAQELLAPLLTVSFPGRFFLAGGAFKSLLHGRPPHDLDLWPATLLDRQALLLHLRARGARLLDDNPPYQTTFLLAEQRIEVSHDCGPTSLEERLSRFDLGLSAIGVEYAAGQWRGVVHPRASESLHRREVLLLRPLVNWKYLLTTLERLHRYSAELGYDIPASEERFLWDLFDAQPRAAQEDLMARHARVAREVQDVLSQARARLRP